MIKLIGQYDSPFTRRVGVTLTLYGLAFEHSTWSVFGNADELAAVNPLIRVPTLVLDTGEALIETAAIIDYLDSLVPPATRLLPQKQPERYRSVSPVACPTWLCGCFMSCGCMMCRRMILWRD
jgi:glutathione S-transferase